MKDKKFQKLSVVALFMSVFPLTTFIPILMNITLGNEVKTFWAGVNIICIIISLIISVACVKNNDSRSIINIISVIISGFWGLIICGIVLALFLHSAQSATAILN